MIHAVEMQRRGGLERFRGTYWMYSESEARSRGIKYKHWKEGLVGRDFLDGLSGPWCLVEQTLDKTGKLFLPPMVIPVFYVDYNIARMGYHGKNAVALQLVTFRWIIYSNKGNIKTFWEPEPDARWSAKSNRANIKTSVDEFVDGFGVKDLEFVQCYLREMVLNNPADAVLAAYKIVWPRRQATRLMTLEERAFTHLRNIQMYMESGMANANRIKTAYDEIGLSDARLVQLKVDMAEDKDVGDKCRKDCINELMSNVGLHDDEDSSDSTVSKRGERGIIPYGPDSFPATEKPEQIPYEEPKALGPGKGNGKEAPDGTEESSRDVADVATADQRDGS